MTGGAELRRVALPLATADGEPCRDCGDGCYADGFCTACGNGRAVPDRDWVQLGEIVVMSDRGLRHSINEDAAAAGIIIAGSGPDRPDPRVAVVCDGVSSSTAARLASSAASTTGVDAMLAALAADESPHAAVVAGLTCAASAAESAGAEANPGTAPSCTYTAAVVIEYATGAAQITVGNVGDSRAYWLPLPPGLPRQLTVDDSVAQQLVNAGLPADSPAVARMAHVLSRWLGGDTESKPWSESSVQTIDVDEPGLLLLCTDGLWNYLPEAADIASVRAEAEGIDAARVLVDHALRAGGHDNVTVVLIPIGGDREFD